MSTDAARLLAEVSAGRLTVEIGALPGEWMVFASSHVGAIVTPELEILIRPKVPMENVFHMLDVATPHTARSTFGFGTDRGLLAAVAVLFARSIERAIGNGLLRSYRPEQDRLQSLRGRIDIGAVVRTPRLPAPIPCTYDEFTAEAIVERGALYRLVEERQRRQVGL